MGAAVRPHGPEDTPAGRAVAWWDERMGIAPAAGRSITHAFPRHWSFLLGELALFAFLVLVATGVPLALLFEASAERLVYEGPYVPLQGVEMSGAYRSVLEISLYEPAGLVLRQTHHWAALAFLGATAVHMLRVFVTAAFRRPRELGWVIGVAILVLSLAEGFAGYSLPDDLLGGTGLRIAGSSIGSIPLVGVWLSRLVFGEQMPGTAAIPRLFVYHVLVLPALITALVGVHVWLVGRLRHTQFPGPGRKEGNVVGPALWPSYAAKSVGVGLLTVGVLVAMGGLLQINPVWLYGPYDPFLVSSGSQADWYLLWVQGLDKLMPGTALSAFGLTVPNIFVSGVLVPVAGFVLLVAWPWIEARATGDRQMHHLLDRPRDAPWRTGLAVAGCTMLALLVLVGADDVVAAELDLSLAALRNAERVAVLTLPPLVGALTAWRLHGRA